MNTEDYVSYELAKALKACGFDWRTDHFYRKDADNGGQYTLIHSGFDNYNEHWSASDWCSAPLLFYAQKWLREKWGIHVDACIYSDYSTDADGKICDSWDFWAYELYAVVGGYRMLDEDGEYDSYEQALSAGISAALKLIKKGE